MVLYFSAINYAITYYLKFNSKTVAQVYRYVVQFYIFIINGMTKEMFVSGLITIY